MMDCDLFVRFEQWAFDCLTPRRRTRVQCYTRPVDLQASAISAILFLSGCGHENNDARDSGISLGQDEAGPQDAGRDIDRVDASMTRIEAAKEASEKSAECNAIGSFYWEVGDAKGPIVSGSTGAKTYTASAAIPIASASKFLWAAYVVERFKSNVAGIDMAAMTMRSGYTSFASCIGTLTVTGCLNKNANGTHNAADDGFFTYGGGHFQKYAVDLGLGPKTNATLAAEIASLLGADLNIAFVTPQPAGGVNMAPGDYGHFLRKILDGTLSLRQHLGEGAVCTLSSACPQAHESPAPEAWHYSYGHWVEDDPSTGDGAFSSPGLFGFYPWIASTKDLYGIIARHATTGLSGPAADTAYWKSVLCGRTIRKAFIARP